MLEILNFRIAGKGTWMAEKRIVMIKKYKRKKEYLEYQRRLVSRLV
jgi:hypothetical protein